jgi:hypothetical protein
MTQAVLFIEDRACPFYVCDVCKLNIYDPGMAMVAWGQSIKDTPKRILTIHVHKGDCLDLFEHDLPKGEELMTVELTHNVRMLLDNTFRKDKRALDRIVGELSGTVERMDF